jgi:hypothetical protein
MVPMMEVLRYCLAGVYSVLSWLSHSMRVLPALRWSSLLRCYQYYDHKRGTEDKQSNATVLLEALGITSCRALLCHCIQGCTYAFAIVVEKKVGSREGYNIRAG